MRKLLKDLFYVPKYGKIQDKVMTMRLVASVMIVVGCLAAMSLSAYAFFSYNITSGSNLIAAATFEIDVSIKEQDANGPEIEVITSNRKSYWASLEADTPYFVTLKHTQNSTTETGFVIITVEDCPDFHTQQLGRDGDGVTETITFKLQANADTGVKLFSHWGTSSYYDAYRDKGDDKKLYITNGDDVQLIIPAAESEKKNNESTTPTTEPEESTAPSTEMTTPATIPETTTAPTTAETEPTSATGPEESTAPAQPAETTFSEQATEPTKPTEETTAATEQPQLSQDETTAVTEETT